MEILSLALKANLPVIAIKSDDLIFIPEVLSWISGKEFKVFSESSVSSKDTAFYTNTDVGPATYLKLKEAGKMLVVVNVKPTSVYFNGGTMFPPKDMMAAYLEGWLTEFGIASPEHAGKMAGNILHAFGGLTLKEAFEILKMSEKATEEEITTRAVNKVRGGMIGKNKGISQVESSDDYYECPGELEQWMEENLDFLKSPIHPALTPRGLLFTGPPGTGKTAGAKYIADQLGVPLYRLDVGGAKGKYVGDSESNLQAALTQIDQASPCVVLIDEVEKVFSAQGDQGVTTSMLGALLWWLQEHKTQVFTVMTTNNVTIIPPELWREGRIDRDMLFNGIDTVVGAVQFMSAVYERLAGEIKMKVDPKAVLPALTSQAKTLYAEYGGAVPQAKLVARVRALVKQAWKAAQ